MSAPAQKPRPAPVTTIARTSGSFSASSSRCVVALLERVRPGVQPLGPVEREDEHGSAPLGEDQVGRRRRRHVELLSSAGTAPTGTADPCVVSSSTRLPDLRCGRLGRREVAPLGGGAQAVGDGVAPGGWAIVARTIGVSTAYGTTEKTRPSLGLGRDGRGPVLQRGLARPVVGGAVDGHRRGRGRAQDERRLACRSSGTRPGTPCRAPGRRRQFRSTAGV